MDTATYIAIEKFKKLLRVEDQLTNMRDELNVLVFKLTDEQQAEYWKVTEEINQRW